MLIFHVYANVPAPTTFVTTGAISKGKGPYGTSARGQDPDHHPGQGSLTSFKATIFKTFNYKGKKESVLTATCKTGSLKARGEFIFADGTEARGQSEPGLHPGKVRRETMIKKTIALSLTAMLLFAVAAPLALALTRDEYKAQVEPICKKNSEANDKILKTVRKEVKENKLKTAGANFIQASTALKKTYNELKAVEQPAEDAAKLTKWLGYVKEEANCSTAVARRSRPATSRRRRSSSTS